MILNILIVFLLLFISIQDFKYRSIYLILFPIGLIIYFLKALSVLKLPEFFYVFGLNLGILLVILLLVTFYFSVKNKKIVNITKESIAWGDILFYVLICAAFSTLHFILFYILSLFYTLILIIFISIFNKNIKKSIPLAGILSIFLIIVHIISMIYDYNLYNDFKILDLLI